MRRVRLLPSLLQGDDMAAQKGSGVTVGSRWGVPNSDRVFVVFEKLPFGRLLLVEEGRAVSGHTTQKCLLQSHIRLPDQIQA